MSTTPSPTVELDLGHPPRGIWAPRSRNEGSYAAFRGRFHLPSSGKVVLRTFGAHEYRVWLNGAPVAEGPMRFHPQFPRATDVELDLPAGDFVLAAIGHQDGVSMRHRHSPAVAPFFAATVTADIPDSGKSELPVSWVTKSLDDAVAHRNLRVSPNLGWTEWWDYRLIPSGWSEPKFEDGEWDIPVSIRPNLGPLGLWDSGLICCWPVAGTLVNSGPTYGTFELYPENVVWGFCHRTSRRSSATMAEQVGRTHDETGTWMVFDLGQTRLVRPRIRGSFPPGTHVAIGYDEQLSGGHVHPVIYLSNGPSCNIDHFVCRGGDDTLEPLVPKGARFVEVHINIPDLLHDLVSVEFEERCTLPPQPAAAFECSDPKLNEVWNAGVRTLRGCADDALVDCVQRERGQWTGDTVTVGLELLAAIYGDLALVRRCLIQVAEGARAKDGLLPARCPGLPEWHTGYPLLWTTACERFYHHTGDLDLLRQLWEPARRNAEIYLRAWELGKSQPSPATGHPGMDVSHIEGSHFIDWGYRIPPGEPDLALHLQFYQALKSLVFWSRVIGLDGETLTLSNAAREVEEWLSVAVLPNGDGHFPGYHATALALASGFYSSGNLERPATDFLMAHIMDCFPNNPDGFRLTQPECVHEQVITPYFGHHVFPALYRMGEACFVHQQYRTCWHDYLLEDGRTTFPELFDPHWSHCHHWSACPTWQLTRYGLGLHPEVSGGQTVLVLDLHPGDLEWAQGSILVAAADGPGKVSISWQRDSADPCQMHYKVHSDQTINIKTDPSDNLLSVRGTVELRLQLVGSAWMVKT